MQTITFIGNGNMALSIAEGLKHKYHIEVVGRNEKRLDEFERKLGKSVDKHLIDNFDIAGKTLILCVKPGNLDTVASQLKGKARLLLSVLAGVTLQQLSDAIKTDAVVRAMPNLAAEVGASVTALTGDEHYREEVEVILRGAGDVVWLESETALDIATALAGSGPAYLAIVAEALIDGAVGQGLPRAEATRLTQGLFKGFGALVEKQSPTTIKERVMSPGGTTAAGCGVLEAHAVRAAFADAIDNALKRAKTLAQKR